MAGGTAKGRLRHNFAGHSATATSLDVYNLPRAKTNYLTRGSLVFGRPFGVDLARDPLGRLSSSINSIPKFRSSCAEVSTLICTSSFWRKRHGEVIIEEFLNSTSAFALNCCMSLDVYEFDSRFHTNLFL